MTEVLYEAPGRDDNWCGPRDFAYLAEVDILGWKFRKMADGGVIIDTPKVTIDQASSNMIVVLSPGHAALVQALLALEQKQGPEAPDSWEDIGKVVQA